MGAAVRESGLTASGGSRSRAWLVAAADAAGAGLLVSSDALGGGGLNDEVVSTLLGSASRRSRSRHDRTIVADSPAPNAAAANISQSVACACWSAEVMSRGAPMRTHAAWDIPPACGARRMLAHDVRSAAALLPVLLPWATAASLECLAVAAAVRDEVPRARRARLARPRLVAAHLPSADLALRAVGARRADLAGVRSATSARVCRRRRRGRWRG